MIDIDVSTNLPALPDDMFWRIGVSDYGFIRADTLFLMKRVPRRWRDGTKDVYVASELLTRSKGTQGIKDTAMIILKNLRIDNEWSKVYGDYPPKRLTDLSE